MSSGADGAGVVRKRVTTTLGIDITEPTTAIRSAANPAYLSTGVIGPQAYPDAARMNIGS
jgi:hypothetical protein